MRPAETRSIARAVGVVGGATLLSRILGFVRDMVVAAFFGAGLVSDSFFAAFRIPNLFRRLFAEGSLSMAFVPVFADTLGQRGRAEAFEMARSAIRLVALVLTILVVLGIFSSPLIVRVIAYGFTTNPDKLALTVMLTRIMFPFVFCICLVALCMGILNVLDHFTAPALAPVVLNVAMIASVFAAARLFEDETLRIIVVAIGVVVGGVLQLALQLPFLIRKGVIFWKAAPLIHPALKRVARLMIPALFGAGVYQLNVIVVTFLATLLQEGSVSYLYYADRLVQFPLGIFAISIGTATLPTLSRQASKNDMDGMRRLFRRSLAMVACIMMPATVGLMVLSKPIVALLFQRGAFDAGAVSMTASALLHYCVGLWAVAAVRVIVPAYYAVQDTVTPVKAGIFTMITNVALGVGLMPWKGHAGLALAVSLSSILNFLFLITQFQKRIGAFGGMAVLWSTARSLVCALLMGAGVAAMSWYFGLNGEVSSRILATRLAVCILTGILLYVAFSFVIQSREIRTVANLISGSGNNQ